MIEEEAVRFTLQEIDDARLYEISTQVDALRVEFEKLVYKLRDKYPTKNKASKQMLEVCEDDAIKRLDPDCLFQFYNDNYHLLDKGVHWSEIAGEGVSFEQRFVSIYLDLRMHTMDDDGNGNTIELDVAVDENGFITEVYANWY